MKYKQLILTGLLIAAGSAFAAPDENLADIIKEANAAGDTGKVASWAISRRDWNGCGTMVSACSCIGGWTHSWVR